MTVFQFSSKYSGKAEQGIGSDAVPRMNPSKENGEQAVPSVRDCSLSEAGQVDSVCR
jgi:hypothetical protein